MGFVVSMQPRSWPQVPEATVRVARAAFPKGGLPMTVRDQLGEVFADEQFADAFAVRGAPAESPGMLAAGPSATGPGRLLAVTGLADQA
jgi:hypothetical protein